jgi:hypothetical protein
MIHIPGRAYPVKELFLEDVLEATKFVIDENSQYSKKVYTLHLPPPPPSTLS